MRNEELQGTAHGKRCQRRIYKRPNQPKKDKNVKTINENRETARDRIRYTLPTLGLAKADMKTRHFII